MLPAAHRDEDRQALLWTLVCAGLLTSVLVLPPPDAARGLAAYAPLHTALEVFAIAVAALITGIAWSTQRYEPSPRVALVGSLFLGVCLLDLSHALSYQGMPDFVTPGSPEKAIHFWLAARVLSVLALGVAAVPNAWLARWPLAHVPRVWTLAVLIGVGLLHVWFLGYPDTVPRTFIPGQGLTPLKLGIEYALIVLYLAAALLHLQRHRRTAAVGAAPLSAAAAILAMSEFFFTRYANVTDVYNLLGHLYKVAGYIFLYRALFVETVRHPYQGMIESRERLRATIDALPDLLFEVDQHGVYRDVHANEPGKLIAPAETLVGRRLADVLPPDAATACLDAIARADRDGVARGTRITLHVADSVRHFELSVSRRNGGDRQGEPTFLVLSRDVTDSMQQEEAAAKEARLNAGLLEIHHLAQNSSEVDFLKKAVDKAEALTDSRIAFIHFVNHDQETIELVTWSTATLEHYCRAAYDRHYPLQQAGIWADALRQRRPVVVNDYATATGKHGLPPGHAALERLISLPVLEGDQVRMMVGVGNKPAPYTPEDVLTLQIVANSVWTHVKRRRQEDRIRLLSFGLDQNPNPVVITDAQATIQYVNAAFTAVTGYRADEVIGRNPRVLQSGQTPADTYAAMWQQLSTGHPWRGEFINRRQDGRVFVEQAMIFPMRDEHGQIAHYVAHKEDITERREVENRVRQLANFDALTGLANRQSFEQTLREQMAQPGARCAVLWLDLDNFKLINETLGHGAGDVILLEVANRLRQAVPERVKLARPPGDAFLALIPDGQHAGAAMIAGRMLEALQAPFHDSGQELGISGSVGLAVAPDDTDSADALLSYAESAMYAAKQAGRSTYRFYSEMLQQDGERTLRLLSGLKQAVARQELRMVYQPQGSLRDGRLVGAEALLRWRSPALGDVSPAEFIPLAEQSGMIIPIGAWVLDQVARQVRAWRDAGLQGLPVAVNLSGAQFRQPDLIDQVQRTVAAAGIEPTCLELELTEAVALQNPERARQTLNALSDLGFRLAIDDFGTGYSSMSYLKQFAVDKLKIDASFVRELDTSADDQAIVTAIVQMAHGLGMHTIAEGVETESQARYLQARGCDEIQGYWFGRPMEAADFEAFWRQALQPTGTLVR